MNALLAPISWIYSLVMDVRNWMFTHGWLHEREFRVTIICVGNLAVGGTGKTPHCVWLVESMLQQGKRAAILSRGYGRKTSGFLEATASSTAEMIGDEPLQMFLHFGCSVVVAVCEDRCKGIETLLEKHPDIDVIVLDDAFQHRYVRPSRRILLTDYNRLYSKDHVIPWGRLRESRKGAERADVIIVSKCPSNLSEEEMQAIREQLKPNELQKLYFTRMKYASMPELETTSSPRVALLAGIAHPEPFKAHFEAKNCPIVHTLFFSDHHNFSKKDVARIEDVASDVDYIVTTAKDYARLLGLPFQKEVLNKIKVQHISVSVLNEEETLLQSL